MIRKIVYVFLILCLSLFITFWVIKLTGDPKPSSGTEEYLKLHGYVDGQVNEIRVGEVLLRFPAGIKFSPQTSGKIVKGQADSVTTGIYYPIDLNDDSSLGRVRIELKPNGFEDPRSFDKEEEKEQWKKIVQRHDLNLIEYHRKISGGWGGVTYVAQSDKDRTPLGSLIRFRCSDINSKIVECWGGYVHPNKTIVWYFIAGENLNNWKSIHGEVVKFIDSIIVEE